MAKPSFRFAVPLLAVWLLLGMAGSFEPVSAQEGSTPGDATAGDTAATDEKPTDAPTHGLFQIIFAGGWIGLAVLVALLGALGPVWWDDLIGQSWSLVVLIPLLWPTVLFLAVRGMD